MHGLGIYETGYLGEKTVYVQWGNTGEFIDISGGVDIISQHHKLRNIPKPVSSLVGLYIIISSCDYVFGFSKEKFVGIFLDNAEYICSGGSLVNHLDSTISKNSFIRLICSMYFYGHKDFFRHKNYFPCPYHNY